MKGWLPSSQSQVCLLTWKNVPFPSGLWSRMPIRSSLALQLLNRLSPLCRGRCSGLCSQGGSPPRQGSTGVPGTALGPGDMCAGLGKENGTRDSPDTRASAPSGSLADGHAAGRTKEVLRVLGPSHSCAAT